MPQDGSNNYQYPPGTPGVPNQTIESEAYNTFLDDLVVNDLNIARPIHRGGTGATTAAGARDNLDTEVAGAQVTNYDSHIWEAGSFSSAVGATAAPTDTEKYQGIAAVIDVDNLTIEAWTFDATPDKKYARQKVAGVWSSWSELSGSVADGDARYVNVTGSTMTGLLSLSGNPENPLNAVPRQWLDATAVRYETSQSLTGAQKIQARTNIGAIGNLGGQQSFTASGTWTKPAGLTGIIIRLVGGGAAGGGVTGGGGTGFAHGGGGGAGGYEETYIPAASLGATATVTVGAGGTSVLGATGNSGGTTSFGGGWHASGGLGGSARAAGASPGASLGGQAGIGSNGWVSGGGSSGFPGCDTIGDPVGGQGGSVTPFGTGGKGANASFGTATAGQGGDGRGSGGGGATVNNSSSGAGGGVGKSGIVLIWEFF